jgi:hypothetical protein
MLATFRCVFFWLSSFTRGSIGHRGDTGEDGWVAAANLLDLRPLVAAPAKEDSVGDLPG